MIASATPRLQALLIGSAGRGCLQLRQGAGEAAIPRGLTVRRGRQESNRDLGGILARTGTRSEPTRTLGV